MALDFGVGSYLEKFEDHFGRGWTKALLIVIGLAITGGCFGIIWQYLVSPVLTFFQAPGRLQMLGNIVLVGACISSGSFLGLRTYQLFLVRKIRRDFERVQASDLSDELKLQAYRDLLGEIEELATKLKKTFL